MLLLSRIEIPLSNNPLGSSAVHFGCSQIHFSAIALFVSSLSGAQLWI